MKKICFNVLLSIITLFGVSMNSFAQDIPTDSGLGGNPFGTWAGDTIIYIPTIPIRGGGNQAPAAFESICAIYRQGYVFITTRTEIVFSYAVRNEDLHPVLRGQATTSATVPALIDLTTLPSGYYTLLLYLNNECLEGEFEKE